jgi:SAM-dependent methyltransferase
MSPPLPRATLQVINTDISPVVIDHMRTDMDSWPDAVARANCCWQVADCRSMPQFEDGTFGAVVDKGTLDAVLCSGTGLGDVRCYVGEAHRLLAPGGSFVLISLGAPDARLTVLRAQPRRRRPSSADAATAPPWPGAGGALPPPPAAAAPSLSARLAARFAAAAEAAEAAATAALPAGAGRREVRWASVLVYLLPKPSLYLQNEASLTGRTLTSDDGSDGAPGTPPRRCVGKDEPVAWLGPYEVGRDLEAALAAPGVDARDFFFAYVCTKAGPDVRTRRRSSLASEAAAAAAARAAAAIAAAGGAPLGRTASYSAEAAPDGAPAPAAAAAAAH